MLTYQGLFRYKRLPMGLMDSGAVFQWLIAQTLAGVSGAMAYIDDILIFGATKEEHVPSGSERLLSSYVQVPVRCLKAHIPQSHHLQ